MGYRIGFQCVETLESAHDYVLSQVQPLLNQDGTFIRPEKVGQYWYLNGQKVVLSFPQCSFAEQMQNGMLVSSSLVMVFIVMFGFKVVRDIFYGFGHKNDN